MNVIKQTITTMIHNILGRYDNSSNDIKITQLSQDHYKDQMNER